MYLTIIVSNYTLKFKAFNLLGLFLGEFCSYLHMHEFPEFRLTKLNSHKICILILMQSTPIYLSEMAPYRYRGALNMVFQLSITCGIVVANLANYFFNNFKFGWRLSLGCAVVPALIFIAGSLFLPDTPNSLIERGNHEEAKARLQIIRGKKVNIEEEFQDLIIACNEAKKIEHPWLNIMKRKYRPQLTFAILIPAFQQLTGMNVYTFYAPVLYKTIGFGTDASLMSALISGGVNAVSTMVSIFTVDKVGRRPLFLEGGIQMIVCQVIFIKLIFSPNV